MWTWHQAAGELRHNGKLVSRGYSGKGRGKNNPSMQHMQAMGPIPRGDWKLIDVYNSKRVGPFAITVHAADGTADDRHDETGRSAFRIHGDSIKAPGTASMGCIILPRAIREQMWRSGDRDLRVVE